jgi:5-formyltetrahydrofolate cyclo-ligase
VVLAGCFILNGIMQHTPEHYFHYTKSQWRRWALAWHNSLMQMRRDAWDATIQHTLYQHLLCSVEALPIGKTLNLGIYAPFRGEVNLWPLYHRCFEEATLQNIRLWVPRMETEGALSWHVWDSSIPDFWETTPYGLQQPSRHSTPVENIYLDAMFIPCQMLDASGIRLGYGGGYYDRQLARWQNEGILPKQRIGVVYHECFIPELPREAHDVPLTHHVGEQGLTVLEARSGRPARPVG